GGQSVAGGQVELVDVDVDVVVGAGLEAAHVLGHVVVALDHLADLAFVGGGGDLEIGRDHRRAQQVRRPLHEGQGRLGGRGGGDVVGDGSPQRRRRHRGLV